MSVSYGGESITFADNSTISSGWTGFKNRLINGLIQIDQRFAGANTGNTVFDGYTVDRWMEQNSGVYVTCQQVADAPSGFYNSYKKIINVANNFSSSGYSNFQQLIERNNVTDLKWGTADASPLTLSFWVKSSLAGLHSVTLQNYNSGTRRSYVTGYTINQANTWEYKTVTFPGDTSVDAGSGNALNGASLQVRFSQGAVSQYTTSTLGSWQSADKFFNENAVKVASTVGATWQITGIQVERGSTASSFEYRPYGTELQLCQRYCYVHGDLTTAGQPMMQTAISGSGSSTGFFQLPVTMRSAPSGTFVGSGFYGQDNSAGPVQLTSLSVNGNSTRTYAAINCSHASGLTNNASRRYYMGSSEQIIFSAEL